MNDSVEAGTRESAVHIEADCVLEDRELLDIGQCSIVPALRQHFAATPDVHTADRDCAAEKPPTEQVDNTYCPL